MGRLSSEDCVEPIVPANDVTHTSTIDVKDVLTGEWAMVVNWVETLEETWKGEDDPSTTKRGVVLVIFYALCDVLGIDGESTRFDRVGDCTRVDFLPEGDLKEGDDGSEGGEVCELRGGENVVLHGASLSLSSVDKKTVPQRR